jgi:hypothetical protein
MGVFFSKLYQKFFSKKLELCLLGLENAGKTTFVDTLLGKPKKTLPTIGLNVKDVKKGSKKIFYNIFYFRCSNENLGYRRTIPIPTELDRLCKNG